MNSDDFLNGERFQQIAGIYIGNADDFRYNPLVFQHQEKHCLLDHIIGPFNNPSIVFVYTHLIGNFAEKVSFFMNPFSLITHNSDGNLIGTDPVVLSILNVKKLVCWWGQNICFIHPKLKFLPIGLANTMWDHGKINNFLIPTPPKTNDVFFNFSLNTNPLKRETCYEKLKTCLEFLPMVSNEENTARLATYKWCVCP